MRTRWLDALVVGLVGVTGGCSGTGAPVAFDDEVSAAPGTSVEIPVLSNDSDPQGDPLVLRSVTSGGQGEARLTPRNTIVYTARAGARGEDAFTYQVADNRGNRSEAKVRVVFSNLPPAASLAPGEAIIDSLVVMLHTGQDDKDRAESVRLAVRRGETVMSDRLVGVGERWEPGSTQRFVVDLAPGVLVEDADLLVVGVQKLPVGPGTGAGWSVAPEVQARLSNGRIVTLLPRGAPQPMGDGAPYDRVWPLSRVHADSGDGERE